MIWELKDVFVDECGNVYTCMKGQWRETARGGIRTFGYSLSPGTDLTSTRTQEKITGPGIGDNSLGLAGLFGLVLGFK